MTPPDGLIDLSAASGGEKDRGLALVGIFVGTLLISMIVVVMGLSSW